MCDKGLIFCFCIWGSTNLVYGTGLDLLLKLLVKTSFNSIFK